MKKTNMKKRGSNDAGKRVSDYSQRLVVYRRTIAYVSLGDKQVRRRNKYRSITIRIPFTAEGEREEKGEADRRKKRGEEWKNGRRKKGTNVNLAVNRNLCMLRYHR